MDEKKKFFARDIRLRFTDQTLLCYYSSHIHYRAKLEKNFPKKFLTTRKKKVEKKKTRCRRQVEKIERKCQFKRVWEKIFKPKISQQLFLHQHKWREIKHALIFSQSLALNLTTNATENNGAVWEINFLTNYITTLCKPKIEGTFFSQTIFAWDLWTEINKKNVFPCAISTTNTERKTSKMFVSPWSANSKNFAEKLNFSTNEKYFFSLRF